MFHQDYLKDLGQHWNLTIEKARPDIEIAGSPERCNFRRVIEDNKGQFFIIENIFPDKVIHKIKIAQTLDYLYRQKLNAIQPYLRSSSGEFVIQDQHRYWQIIPFRKGVSLKRPDYIQDSWRGIVLADFLISLRQKSEKIPYFKKTQPFSILAFIYDLVGKLEQWEPDLLKKNQPALAYLESEFKQAHDQLPVAFCHGDYHPLNIIWSALGINAVIDWEFLGWKPEIYDIGILIGCIGIEDPQSLTSDLVFDFIQRLKLSNLIADISWDYLLEFTIALRFAWLSEWLRFRDREMIDLETEYILLLCENHDKIKKAWFS